jgi:4'-phosphopantetheinyl transferase EntD
VTAETRAAAAVLPGFRSLVDDRVLVAERRVEHVVGTTELRRLEHIMGRDLAAHLMRRMADRERVASLDVHSEIGRGSHGEPLFPTGVVGSIAHSAGLVAAAVAARRSGVLSIGVDVHPAGRLPGDVVEFVGGDREVRSAPRLRALGMASAVLFSAKESVFKAWFSLMGEWLEFDSARLSLRDDGCFRVAEPVSSLRWSGRWAVSDGVIRTAAVLTV